ncbi:protein APCDD1-like [Haliotis cracherodii]|uniref:protein APCDD1-like n=1 Tax=Haliotis cracherodii TaxID=6455 RepID=UPI0039E81B8F
MSKRTEEMGYRKHRLIYLALLFTGVLLPGGGARSYHVYSEDWRERECGRVLNRVQHDHMENFAPNLVGEWTSYRCEIRSGPEYLLRKYKFSENTFEVHQYYYNDPDCNDPRYAIVAHGTYRQLRQSWLVPGGTESEYQVIKAHVIPYSPDIAKSLQVDFNRSCKVLGTVKLETFEKQVFMSIPLEKPGEGPEKTLAKDIDCSHLLNFTLSELQLMRVEIKKHKTSHSRDLHDNDLDQGRESGDVKHHVRKIHDLLLGSVHTNRKLRHRHRPSSFQIALRNSETQGCSVCARIANSNDYYPPELHTHPGSILSLEGDWVSTRCESRQQGMFLTRWLTFLPDGRSWQGIYDFFKDSSCSEPTFTLTAKGNYVGGDVSSIIPHSKDYSFKVTRLKVTPKSGQIVGHLNHYQGGKCGTDRSWVVGVEQDVTFTNGCVTLGIQLPNIEQEILKMEVVHRQLHLLVGSRFTDAPTTRFRDKRPTSFQEPLVKCDRFHSDIHINSIYEGRALPLSAPLISQSLESSSWAACPTVLLILLVTLLQM